MHFVHIFLLLFKFKGRGKFVPLVYILSSLLVALIYAGLHSQCRFNPRRLLCVGSLFLAGMINPHLTKIQSLRIVRTIYRKKANTYTLVYPHGQKYSSL
jgi:peptidoglycan/LPS O-acetylase OafA/YrhL